MQIIDTLRQEDEPNIVYAICKMACLENLTKSQIDDLMSDKKDNQNIYKHNFEFAKNCQFIKVNGENVESLIPKAELETYEKFITYIWDNALKTDNVFTKITRWFLGSGTEVVNLAAEQLAGECHTVAIVDQNFIRGWHWWMQAFGLGTISSYLSKGGSRYIMFDCSNALKRYICARYKKNEVVKIRQFLTDLCKDHNEFNGLMNFENKSNQVCNSVSLGLRVLHNLKIIELKYTPDSSDIWHLSESFSHEIKSDITEIKILEAL